MRSGQWRKQGSIFRAGGQPAWMATHAQVPLPHVLGDGRVRILFGTRDEQGRTRTAWLDADAADPSRVLEVGAQPALDLGARGAFDDSGAMPSCLVQRDDGLYLFYVGWQRAVSVPYHTSIGLAVSHDDGRSFARVYDGPVLDRGPREPFFVTMPFVLVEDGRWRMWFSSGTAWLGDPPNPVYVIKHIDSPDGVRWSGDPVTCIVPHSDEEAATRPWVVRDGDGYRMWFCFRGAHTFRDDVRESYRIGIAESPDGVHWTRRDDEEGIGLSDSGWDSDMVAYPALYEHAGTTHLLYNGNGFGASGMGHAIAEPA